ncbi:MAG: DEAD/DEAH box helicase [bacterium]|nr:DEAD/DEAH box helicase [bacterium]
MTRKDRLNKYISPEFCEQIKEEIGANNGNEVFFHAKQDASSDISEVVPLAWGNETSTPAILQRLAPGDLVLHNHPSGNLTPSDPDVQIASILGNQGIGFFIIDNDAKNVNVIVNRFTRPEKEILSPDEISSMLDVDSEIARTLEGYEPRAGQMEMSAEVARSFNEGNVVMFEGGTGTGKTLAYLLPAIKWSLKNKERVLVSTKTINLQEQIIFKDIPFLRKVIDDEFMSVLVKGRGNYCCLRKADSEERDLGLFKDDESIDELASLIKWTRQTKDGSLSDLNYIPRSDVWERIKCESDTCTGVRCAFYEDCFLVSARRNAARANIIIVNHHLLFSDLSLRGTLGSLADIAVLPPYTRVIIDEAHHIEDVSTDYFGAQVTQSGVKRLLGRLVSLSKKGERKGILPRTIKKIRNEEQKTTDEVRSVTDIIERDLIIKKMELSEFAEDIFADISSYLKRKEDGNDDRKQYMFDNRFSEDEAWKSVITVKARGWIKKAEEYTVSLNSVVQDLTDIEESHKPGLENLIIELQSMVRRIAAAADSFHYLLFEEDGSVVKWLEFSEQGRSLKICSAPIDVGEYLVRSLFEPFDTVIMTSATLTVGGEFDFLRSRLGMDAVDNYRVRCMHFPSPFDFENQVLIGIPLNNFSPDQPKYISTTRKLITDSLRISNGRAFVLFTSYSAMNDAFGYAAEELYDMDIKLLKQGTDTRTALLNQFKRERAAALFATDSFWEGVDVIGDDLESIIIARLPFKVPTAPIEVARRQAIDAAGGNSFMDYTVPQAIIKFKQGFGRLIRHKNDRGTILVLDNRIVSKFYGKVFLESLPKCGMTIGRDDLVFKSFREFYDS